MSEIQVASRYAKSLIDIAIEQNALDAFKDDINLFIDICSKNPQLPAILKNPIISNDKKLGVLVSLFTDKIHPIILEFFKIVIKKDRASILYVTGREFIVQYNKEKNIIKATVTSATPLTEVNTKQLESLVKQATKSEVILESKVNPDLIGGFVLKVGDRQYDASIANSLQKLKKEFSEKVTA